jgi:hypothetical protein
LLIGILSGCSTIPVVSPSPPKRVESFQPELMQKCPALAKLPDQELTEEDLVIELFEVQHEYNICRYLQNKLIDAIKAREAQT